LGNARATDAVTQITSQVVELCQNHGGRVVKTLGDGVLAMFSDSQSAVNAVVELQRTHFKRSIRTPVGLRMPMRIGMSSGEVEIVAGDCYGDAVNVASRLCDLSGPHQIWVSAVSLDHAREAKGVSFRSLGPINVRGRAEPCDVYQVEWREDDPTDFLTMQAQLDSPLALGEIDILGREVELSYLGEVRRFKSFELPVHIGRVKNVEFVVNDPRVSRTHARLEWRNGGVVLIDVSSYGSWVRFNGAKGADLLLRREECVLHGSGELALGASFGDATAPKVSFSVL
jgi:hypothetical protein